MSDKKEITNRSFAFPLSDHLPHISNSRPIKYGVSQTFFDTWDKIYGNANEKLFVYREFPDCAVYEESDKNTRMNDITNNLIDLALSLGSEPGIISKPLATGSGVVSADLLRRKQDTANDITIENIFAKLDKLIEDRPLCERVGNDSIIVMGASVRNIFIGAMNELVRTRLVTTNGGEWTTNTKVAYKGTGIITPDGIGEYQLEIRAAYIAANLNKIEKDF